MIIKEYTLQIGFGRFNTMEEVYYATNILIKEIILLKKLGNIFDKTMKRVQSPSSINTYFQCPRKYFYIYNLKMATSPSIYLVRGIVVHKVLENFFKIPPKTFTPDYQTNFQILILNLLKKYWTESLDFDKLAINEEEITMFYQESQIMLINWINQFKNRLENLISHGNSFIDSFKRLTPKTEIKYIDEELMVQGFIDAIEEIDGKIRLMDYKTSKNAYINDAYKTQLAIYALLYERKHGKRPDSVGIYFLKDTEHVLEVDDELIKHALFMVEQIHMCTDGLDNISDYPKKESGLCKWHSGQCDFYEHCFMGKDI